SEIGAGLVNGVNAPWNPRLSAGPFTVSIFDGRIQPQNQKELHEAMVTLGPSLTSNTPPSRRREVRRGGAVNENGGYDPATMPARTQPRARPDAFAASLTTGADALRPLGSPLADRPYRVTKHAHDHGYPAMDLAAPVVGGTNRDGTPFKRTPVYATSDGV